MSNYQNEQRALCVGYAFTVFSAQLNDFAQDFNLTSTSYRRKTDRKLSNGLPLIEIEELDVRDLTLLTYELFETLHKLRDQHKRLKKVIDDHPIECLPAIVLPL